MASRGQGRYALLHAEGLLQVVLQEALVRLCSGPAVGIAKGWPSPHEFPEGLVARRIALVAAELIEAGRDVADGHVAAQILHQSILVRDRGGGGAGCEKGESSELHGWEG